MNINNSENKSPKNNAEGINPDDMTKSVQSSNQHVTTQLKQPTVSGVTNVEPILPMSGNNAESINPVDMTKSVQSSNLHITTQPQQPMAFGQIIVNPTFPSSGVH